MPTTKKRLNITLSPDLEKALMKIARRDRVPGATKAVELLRIALEIEEDSVWEMLANERGDNPKDYVPHSKAWK